MENNKLHYYAEVHDSEGNDERLDSNVHFKKLTTKGVQLGCLLSSMELRGFFDSIDEKIPIKNNKAYPLLTYPFMDFIESHNLTKFNLIEFGSGNSTIYFELIFKNIISFENNFDWYENIKGKIKKTNYQYITSEEMENFNIDISNEFIEKSFVLIDAACNRLKIAKNLLIKYNPSFIILDNSEWYRNTSNYIMTNGYFEIPFWGYKNTEHWESCTSLFINLKNTQPLERNPSYPPPLARRMVNEWDM